MIGGELGNCTVSGMLTSREGHGEGRFADGCLLSRSVDARTNGTRVVHLLVRE
jgi:hypothetical protein